MALEQHKADYLVASHDEDLDPTGSGYTMVEAQPNAPVKFAESNPVIGFNTFTYNLTQNLPIRLLGADPARSMVLLNTSSNADCFIGDQSTVSALMGFNLTNHNAGGSIELHTTEEIWAVTTATTQTVYMYVERVVNN